MHIPTCPRMVDSAVDKTICFMQREYCDYARK
jgi:hypothetical protein